MQTIKTLSLILTVAVLSGCQSLPPGQATVPDGADLLEQLVDKAKAQRGSTFYFIQDFTGARVHGSGTHRYRMVLLHPVAERVMPNQPYALSHSGVDLPFVADEKDVFQGVTDHLGRTDVFAFEQPLNPTGWNLRQRTGQGAYGEQFVIKDGQGNPMQGYAYRLLICGKRPHIYRGLTDALGQTAYAATADVQNITLYDDDGEAFADIHAACQTESVAAPAAE